MENLQYTPSRHQQIPKYDKWAITAQPFIHEQAKDSYCRELSTTVGLPGLTSNSDRNGFLARPSPIYGAVQKSLPTSVQLYLLYYSLYATLAGHLGERCMYDSLRREYYLPHMVNVVNTTVIHCHECVRNKPWDKRRRPLKLFLASGSLELVTMDILGLLPRTLKATSMHWK